MRTPSSASTPALSRRTFLKHAAAGGAVLAAPMIVPSSVFGAGGAVAPANRITVGFIGTGRQAVYANIPGFLHQPDAQVVAVCDVDSWRMEKARRQVTDFYAEQQPAGTFKGCATMRDWRDLIARKDIDAVMISTPDHWHVIMAIAALKAGKDVSCEKPLTRNIAGGRKMADLVLKEKRVFCTDSEFRSYAMCRKAAQLVRNGKLGKPQRIITAAPKDLTIEKRDFLDAVKSRKQPQYDAEGGHRNASLSHLALASIHLGRKLKWDPVAERVIGDDEANKLLLPKRMRSPWHI